VSGAFAICIGPTGCAFFARFRDLTAKLEAESWRMAAPEPGVSRFIHGDLDNES
jgi:hypothetical protein